MRIAGRVAVVAVVLAVCVWFLYPTLVWNGSTPPEERELALGTSNQIRDYARGRAGEGLRTLKALDPSSDLPEELSYLRSLLEGTSKAEVRRPTVGELVSEVSDRRIFDAIEARHRDRLMASKKASRDALQLGLDLKGGLSILLDVDIASFEKKLGRTATDAEISDAIDRDIEVLKSRIDQFGVTEPEIRRRGADRILVEVSGEADPERVDSFLRGKGSLRFQLVDTAATRKAQERFAEHPDELCASDGSFIQPSFIPEGRTLTGWYVKDEYNIDELVGLSVVYDEPFIDGSFISDAIQEFEQIQNLPVVDFTLTGEGAAQMFDITKDHVGDIMAVVMDGNVRTQAQIKSPLSSNIQITGFTLDEAKDIAFLLKSANLPIEVSVASQRTVGASLGEDAVRTGLRAIVAGFVLVVVFMSVYYGLCGLAADLGLVVNMFMIISILAGFKSTFTLAGIAGLILTLGMAVDANVIIFERIKERLREGSTPRNAMETGYKEAFWTIMDSNITTMIAAVALIALGSSSVRGFATTLAVGICSSLFCSLFVCRLVMDLTVRKSIHIGWRRRTDGK